MVSTQGKDARSWSIAGGVREEFGCSAQTIANWIGSAGRYTRRAKPASEVLSSAEREELARLRRQLRQVQMERDILAKATAWFAAQGDKAFTPSSNS